MSDQDQTGVPSHELPPPLPPPLPAMVGIIVLNLVALVAALFGRCSWATIFIILSILLAAFVVYRIMSSSSDVQPVGGHEQPPP
jgi:hypothetical protein